MTLWDDYVTSGARDAGMLVAALSDPAIASSTDPIRLSELAYIAFRLGMSSIAIGADDVGKLALAAERVLDRTTTFVPGAWPIVSAAIADLGHAMHQLVNADKSGARIEGLDLDERVAALEAVAVGDLEGLSAQPSGPVPTLPTMSPPSIIAVTSPPTTPPPTAVRTVSGGDTAPPPLGFTWTPTVDDDMVELFFDEANERVEALAGKLVEIERRPSDADLLRDIFRDMHTVKGSSAMVGLQPVNHLAHAAEDLVGQIRDAGRAVDGAVVDALLAALDGLRDMLGQARGASSMKSRVVDYDPAAIIQRLHNPQAPVQPVATPIAVGAGAAIALTTQLVSADRQTIRVDFDKLDRLLNLVGELVLGRDDLRTAVQALGSITGALAADRGVARRVAHASAAGGSAQRGIEHLGDELSRFERVLAEVGSDLDHGTDRLDAISGELREQVMRLRMIPVGGVFRKHVRTVRDLAASLHKRARLELDGDDTELDKLLVEAIDEPLMHLVRNAVDHGVELPDQRTAAGKPAEATIRLVAAHRGNQVEIRVSDDGRGLDPDKLKARAVDRKLITADEAAAMTEHQARELIFHAGFSTAATVSEISGRGVGMDVVRQTIITRLKGTIDVESTVGQGSTFVLKLPLTLAIIQVLVARAGGETFAIPLDVVGRVLTISRGELQLIGDREVAVVRGKHVPVIRLDHVLELESDVDDELQLVLTEVGGQTYALACEHLIGKREIVIKSLGPLLTNVPCIAGATLLGERVALILDVPAVVRRSLSPVARTVASSRGDIRRRSDGASAAHVLVVDDSDIIREAIRRLLSDAGYVVTVAVDGAHGLELAKGRRFDLVSTDVMMPRMDGYELTRALRAMPEYADAPIVMVTSKDEKIDRVRGFDAGVDEYITKPHDRSMLLRVVRKLLGHAQQGEPQDPGEPT